MRRNTEESEDSDDNKKSAKKIVKKKKKVNESKIYIPKWRLADEKQKRNISDKIGEYRDYITDHHKMEIIETRIKAGVIECAISTDMVANVYELNPDIEMSPDDIKLSETYNNEIINAKIPSIWPGRIYDNPDCLMPNDEMQKILEINIAFRDKIALEKNKKVRSYDDNNDSESGDENNGLVQKTLPNSHHEENKTISPHKQPIVSNYTISWSKNADSTDSFDSSTDQYDEVIFS